MSEKTIPMAKGVQIRETAGLARVGEWVRFSVPFGRGELLSHRSLCLTAPDGKSLPCQCRPLKLWPDGSVKWLMVDAAVDVTAGASSTFIVRETDGAASPGSQVRMERRSQELAVDTGAALFTVDTGTFRPFASVWRNGAQCSGVGGTVLTDASGNAVTAAVERVEVEDDGPLHAVVRLSGRFRGRGFAPSFSARLHFFAGSARATVEFTLHNPRAARHRGGLWDLGDPGSYLFRSLALEIPFSGGGESGTVCYAEQGAAVTSTSDSLAIYQESSGGSNWLSPNHRTRSGKVPPLRRGYRVTQGDRELRDGLRATPVLWLGAQGSGVSAAIPRFWQEFPKALAAVGGKLQVGLFPAQFPEPHELQGGERKTHLFHLEFGSAPGALIPAVAPLEVVVSPEVYREAAVLPDLPPARDDLVDRFCSAKEMLQKRESIDEYGWRNFGELVADHEAAFHAGEEPFVSHYNNQYDACAGAYRKFFATGDPLWGELAGDLARHVLDIDIYHTGEDREEYNGGLFWHTDHYLDAGLSTHRTYSALHLATRDPRFVGGGPAAEHCYTTGLLLAYYLTGNPDYRDAVLSLAQWCHRSLTGPRTLLAAAKRGVGYLHALKGAQGSVFPDHPLTRGTGNAVTASLDAYDVSGDAAFLARAEELIRGALHPHDDIEARPMLHPEAAWSYTVLLHAVAKFLDAKREAGELDAGYAFAREALLAYARWMARREYPYLDKPEILEFPNETWAAQELRKSVVLYHAAKYAPAAERESLLRKAGELLDRAQADLCSFPGSGCTRPVALMLQNGWVAAALAGAPQTELPAPELCHFGPATPRLGGAAVARRLGRELSQALRETTLKREAAWLGARLRG